MLVRVAHPVGAALPGTCRVASPRHHLPCHRGDAPDTSVHPDPLPALVTAALGTAGSALSDPVSLTAVVWAGPMLLLSTLQGQVMGSATSRVPAKSRFLLFLLLAALAA